MSSHEDVYFCPAEEEMIQSLIEMYNITEYQAKETVIRDKRQNAFMYQQRGNLELAEVLLRELGEWNDEWAEEHERLRNEGKEFKKIILLDDNGNDSFK
jgi:hypothetical protein